MVRARLKIRSRDCIPRCSLGISRLHPEMRCRHLEIASRDCIHFLNFLAFLGSRPERRTSRTRYKGCSRDGTISRGGQVHALTIHTFPDCKAVTIVALAPRAQDESDTESTGDEWDIGGEDVGGGRISHTPNFLPHAIKHFPQQIIYGGHVRFYDTDLSEHTHKHTIKWAGSRVRKRDANTTHSDMLLAVWENMILEEIGRKHKVRPRTWTPRASPSGSVRHTRPMDVVCRRSPRNFVHSAIPITWAEACSLASAAFGTAGERARRAVTQERQHLITLNWHWSARCTAFRAGRDNVFVPGDVVRFRGSESLPNSPPTALVAEVSASPPHTHTHTRWDLEISRITSRDVILDISRCDPGYLEM